MSPLSPSMNRISANRRSKETAVVVIIQAHWSSRVDPAPGGSVLARAFRKAVRIDAGRPLGLPLAWNVVELLAMTSAPRAHARRWLIIPRTQRDM